jgi:hypothetical protein
MVTIDVVLQIMGYIGLTLAFVGLFYKRTKNGLVLSIACLILNLPYAAYNLTNENDMLNAFFFVVILLASLLGVLKLANYTEKK